MKTLKVLSLILDYPTALLERSVPELKAAVDDEKLLPAAENAALHALIDAIGEGDLYDLQERWLLLFDRTRTLSLHLFEHVHGESRDRGQAMVDLLKLYEAGGFVATTAELPDYLPMFLEFAATQPPEEALELVRQPADVIAALRERLRKRGSPYEAAFAALVALAEARLDPETVAALLAEPDPDPDDLAALDAAWEEEEVVFGPGAAEACGRDTLAARLRQTGRPAPGVEPPVRKGTRFTHSGHPFDGAA